MIGAIQASEFDWKSAEREFRRALEFDRETEGVFDLYVIFYLVPMRRMDEALAASQKAVEADLLSPFLRRLLGFIYYLMHQYGHAIEQCNNALELDPGNLPAHMHLGQIYIAIMGIAGYHHALQILKKAS